MLKMIEEEFYISNVQNIIFIYSLSLSLLSFVLLMINKQKEHIFLLENMLTIFISIFIVFYFGTRDPWIGVDTQTYVNSFYNKDFDTATEKDLLFGLLRTFFSAYSDATTFLIFCSFIYVGLALLSFYRIFNKLYGYAFLLFLISPAFIMLGINVIRSGMAASIFLLAISMHKQKHILLWMFLSVLMHVSMLIPVSLYCLFYFMRGKWNLILKCCYLFWLGAIVLALLNVNILPFASSFVLELFQDRATMFLMQGKMEATVFSMANFFYVLPILLSLYYVFYKRNVDIRYIVLLEVYIVTNAIFFLFLRIPFSERLGYLSSFMFPVLCFYPYLLSDVKKISCFYISIFVFSASVLKLMV